LGTDKSIIIQFGRSRSASTGLQLRAGSCASVPMGLLLINADVLAQALPAYSRLRCTALLAS